MARLGCRGFWLSLAVGASGLRLSGWRFWLTPWLCGFWLAPGLCPLLGLAHTLAAPSSGARLGCWGFWLSLVVGASGSSLGCVACGLRLGCSGFLLTPWLFQTWTRIILIRSQPLTREPCPLPKKTYIYIYTYSPHSTRDNNIGARHVRGGQQVSRDNLWYGHPWVIAILHDGVHATRTLTRTELNRQHAAGTPQPVVRRAVNNGCALRFVNA